MFDNVLSSVLSWLNTANINAVSKFPDTAIDRDTAIVAVSIKSGVMSSSGAGNYLGIYEQGGTLRELYGSRAEIVFALDIYSPSGDCTEILDGIAENSYSLPDGLKLKSLECLAPEYDAESGMFRQKCSMKCTAILVRTESSEIGEFTDFVLRGELI